MYGPLHKWLPVDSKLPRNPGWLPGNLGIKKIICLSTDAMLVGLIPPMFSSLLFLKNVKDYGRHNDRPY